MKIDLLHCIYTCAFRDPAKGVHQGSLLKVIFPDGLVGYADCHPWEELKDLSLTQQLQLLKQGISTNLTKKSLAFARLDAEARASSKNLFTGLTIPSSNWLMVSLKMPQSVDEVVQARQEGCRYFKVKVGLQNQKELRSVLECVQQLQCRIRLDFNSKLSLEEFATYENLLTEYAAVIDYCEDPLPFEPALWKEMQQRLNISFACDAFSARAREFPEAAQVLVVKPAVQEIAPFLQQEEKRRLAVTSYLDHPLGQLCAAYEAAKMVEQAPNRIGVCGLLTHVVYQPTPFSQELTHQESRLIPPEGTGFGFDQLLQEQKWISL